MTPFFSLPSYFHFSQLFSPLPLLFLFPFLPILPAAYSPHHHHHHHIQMQGGRVMVAHQVIFYGDGLVSVSVLLLADQQIHYVCMAFPSLPLPLPSHTKKKFMYGVSSPSFALPYLLSLPFPYLTSRNNGGGEGGGEEEGKRTCRSKWCHFIEETTPTTTPVQW